MWLFCEYGQPAQWVTGGDIGEQEPGMSHITGQADLQGCTAWQEGEMQMSACPWQQGQHIIV